MKLKQVILTFLFAALSFGLKAQVLSSYAHQLINNQYTLSEYSRIGDSVYYHLHLASFSNYFQDPYQTDNWASFEIYNTESNPSAPLPGSFYVEFDDETFPSSSGVDYYGIIDVSGVNDISFCEIYTGWSILCEDSTTPYGFNIYSDLAVAEPLQ